MSTSNVQSSGLSEEELFELFDLKTLKEKQKKESSTKPAFTDSTLNSLYNLTPEEFEEMVARIYEYLGFAIRLTPKSKDQGVDVIATKSTAGSGFDKYAIQCKRYNVNQTVGRPDAQKLLGVITKDNSYTKGVLVTTSSFSSECKIFTENQGNLELIDGYRLVKLLTDLDIKVNE